MLTEQIIIGTDDKIKWRLQTLNNQGRKVPVKLASQFDKIELHLNEQVFSSINNGIIFNDNGEIIIDIAKSDNIEQVSNCPALVLGFNPINISGVPIIKPTDTDTYALISVYNKEHITENY